MSKEFLDVNEVLTTSTLGYKSYEKAYENIFKSIGKYIEENAERFAVDANKFNYGFTIEINLPIDDIVEFKITNKEYIKEIK